ncbi:MAG TPA: L,D-transpeptidase [Polyangiaceae bacterium]|nr:L,D-transpeptidase [Polyangiaceae bacterium]
MIRRSVPCLGLPSARLSLWFLGLLWLGACAADANPGSFVRRRADIVVDAPSPAPAPSPPSFPVAEPARPLPELTRPPSEPPNPVPEPSAPVPEPAAGTSTQAEPADSASAPVAGVEGGEGGARSEEAVPSVPETRPSLDRQLPDTVLDVSSLPPGPGIPQLVVVQREAFVYQEPNLESRRIGYLRAGTSVPRSSEPVSRVGCKLGFYRVAPEGYVCRNSAVRLNGGDLVSELSQVRAERGNALPYVYVRSTNPPPPLYTKLPSGAEQREAEPESLVRRRLSKSFEAVSVAAQAPAPLLAGKSVPTPFGGSYGAERAHLGRALGDSTYALLQVFQHEQRVFGLTRDLLLIPLDHTERVLESTFHGVAISEAVSAVGFVQRRGALAYVSEQPGALRIARNLAYREALMLSGNEQRISGLRYLETASRELVRADQLLRVELNAELSPAAQRASTYLRVSIANQTLIAYAAGRPAYVTLVSTGRDGAQDPKTTRSTPTGQFRIHTKHVSTTMSSDEVGDEYRLEVPYVQYFSEGYALHTAYWHDAFGSPRSHGCINLSPIDARHLFNWTEPPVPQLWHGAMSLNEGTLLEVVP